MTFADLKEQITEKLTPYWEKIQESDIFQKALERYESLSPRGQKAVIIGGAVGAFTLFIYLVPFTFLETAGESVNVFEKNQKLIRDLFTISRKIKSSPQFPPAPPPDVLKTTVENELINAGLLPEQKISVETATFSMGGVGPKDLISQGLVVYLKQLNLNQITSIGYSLQVLPNMPIKLLGMEISANEKDSHYFDVKYSLTTFSLPSFSTETSAEEAPKGGPRPIPRKRPNK